MAKAIHTMIRVLDLDRSIDFYQRAFGLEVADRFDFDGFALVYLRNAENDFEIEPSPIVTAAATAMSRSASMTQRPNTRASRRRGLSPTT